MAPAEQESAAWAEAAKAAIAEKTTVLKSIVAELHEYGQVVKVLERKKADGCRRG